MSARSSWLLGVMALAAACGDTTTMKEPPGLTGQLDIELRDKIDVQLVPAAEGRDALDVKLTLASGSGYGVLSVGQTLSAKGRRRAMPEAETELYTATFRVPAAASVCPAKAASLALSLVRRGTNARVAGGIAVRCDDGDAARPVRLLRLSGTIPIAPR